MRLIPRLLAGRSARVTFHALAALLLSCTYFAFRVELFEEEAEAHFRQFPDGLAFAVPTLSWETFDKENAPQAFIVRVLGALESSFDIAPAPELLRQDIRPFQPVRDKSPPPIV
jgi:hypothetical protein